MLLRAPGVYQPQRDTWLLAHALRRERTRGGASVLDMCTGTGYLAILAARNGADRVTAVDVSAPAVLTTRANAFLHGQPVRVRKGDLFTPLAAERFHLIVANPPYVPEQAGEDGAGRRPGRATGRGAGRRPDGRIAGGSDGRRVIDRLCDEAPRRLLPNGVLLMVHSALCGTDATVTSLHRAGMDVAVVGRWREPFGPELRRREEWLRGRGLIEDGEREEELVVFRAQRQR